MNNNRFTASDQPDTHLSYRPDIDGLRAVAIVSVVICHAFPTLLPGGFVGVDIFFVISGFLISSIIFQNLIHNTFSLRTFYARRVRRIFPALILILVTSLIIGWYTLSASSYQQLGLHAMGSVGFFINFILWGEAGYFDTDTTLKPLMHLWSLAVEEQFYLVYPLLIGAAWRLKLNIPFTIFLLFTASFMLNVTRVESHNAETFFMLHTRFWELLSGCVLAHLDVFQRNQLINSSNISLRNRFSVLGFFCIATATFGLHGGEHFPGWLALLPVTGASLIIFAGGHAWPNKKILATPVLVFIGLISYPLYLWHWPLLSYAHVVAGDPPTDAMKCAVVTISLILAWLTYQCIEKPLRSGGSSCTWKTVGLITCMLAVAYGGSYIYRHDGLVSRFPPELRALAGYTYDSATDGRYATCWLSKTQPYTDFAPQCLGNTASTPTIFIWGDSYAGRLYPGIKQFWGDKMNIAQFTRDVCPPLLNAGNPLCIKSNKFVLSIIGQYHPHTVVLAARWNYVSDTWNPGEASTKKLLDTIAALELIGVKNIIVLGSGPIWSNDMPKILLNVATRDVLHRIPVRTTLGLRDVSVSIDNELKKSLPGSPATYFSIMDILCNADGCLTHVPDVPDSLVTYDYGHPTTPAALFIAKQLPINIEPANTQNR